MRVCVCVVVVVVVVVVMSMKRLPPLHGLSLSPKGPQPTTGTMLDSEELQDAAEVFAKIWAEAADYSGMTGQQKAWRMCRTMATVLALKKDYIPPSFYMHYAVQLEVPGAGAWKETIYSGKTNEQVAAMRQLPAEQLKAMQTALTEQQRDMLREWCRKVRSADAATAAAVIALSTLSDAVMREVVWLLKRGARPWEPMMRLMLRIGRDPAMWTTTGQEPSRASLVWKEYMEACGGANKVATAGWDPDAIRNTVDLGFSDPNRALPMETAYMVAAYSDNVEMMRLFARTFQRAITAQMRRRVGVSLLFGQVPQALELIRVEREIIAALGDEDAAQQAWQRENMIQLLYRNCAQALTRGWKEDRANAPAGTRPEHIAALVGEATSPGIRNQAFFGATLGLREADLGDLAGYVENYLNLNAQFLLGTMMLLVALLGLRVGLMRNVPRNMAQFASGVKFRELVSLIGPLQVPYRVACGLLGSAAGVHDPTMTNPAHFTRPDDYLDWNVDQMRAVRDALGGARFSMHTLCRAMGNAFRRWDTGLATEQGVDLPFETFQQTTELALRERLDLLEWLVGRLPGSAGPVNAHPNRFAVVHKGVGESLLGLFDATFAAYLAPIPRVLDSDIAASLLDAWSRMLRTFRDAGITVGVRPDDSIDGTTGEAWRMITRLISAIQRDIPANRSNGSPLALSKIQLAETLLGHLA